MWEPALNVALATGRLYAFGGGEEGQLGTDESTVLRLSAYVVLT